MEESTQPLLTLCAYLGLATDPETSFSYPSPANHCFHCKSPAVPLLQHQENYCLSGAYQSCPVFAQAEKRSFPKLYQAEKIFFSGRLKMFFVLLGLFLLFGVLLLVGWPILSVRVLPTGQNLFPPPQSVLPTKTAQPTHTLLQPTTTLALIGTLPPPPAPTETPISTITQPATATSITNITIGIETPSSTTPQLLLHRIVSGDNFVLLANRYRTSVAAIQSINYVLPNPLWVDWIAVIPLNTTDTSGLPAFETYQTKDSSMTLAKVAQALNANLELMSLYNPYPPDEVLPVDSWLLIPHLPQSTKTP